MSIQMLLVGGVVLNQAKDADAFFTLGYDHTGSNSTPRVVAGLQVNLIAGKKYRYQLGIKFSASFGPTLAVAFDSDSITAGSKIELTRTPANPTTGGTLTYSLMWGGATSIDTTPLVEVAGSSASISDIGVWYTNGIIVPAVNGQLRVLVSQSSNADNIIIRKGTWMKVEECA